MFEKEKLKQQEAAKEDIPDEPPGYEEVNNDTGYYQRQYSDYPDEKKQGYTYPDTGKQQNTYSGGPPNYGPNYGPNDGPNYGAQNGYNPMDDPNVYKVPPQLVNISQANPQHLNPSYPQFLQREQQRRMQGDFPQQFKHGAPLEPSVKNNQKKTGGGAFPGRSGVTYNNAANR